MIPLADTSFRTYALQRIADMSAVASSLTASPARRVAAREFAITAWRVLVDFNRGVSS